jgi:hypothetical protein
MVLWPAREQAAGSAHSGRQGISDFLRPGEMEPYTILESGLVPAAVSWPILEPRRAHLYQGSQRQPPGLVFCGKSSVHDATLFHLSTHDSRELGMLGRQSP